MANSSQRNEEAGGGKAWGKPEMFCVSVTLFFPLFHYKELALREDVYTKRLHPSRLLGFHGSVIDIVNQRRHTSDKPIGGINKLTITAQWVSFPLLFMSIRFIHLCLQSILLLSPYSLLLPEKMHVSGVNILFYWAVKVTKNKKTELNWKKHYVPFWN